MIGAFVVFGVVLAIVFTYMAIVHKFLVDAEAPGDAGREEKSRRDNVTRSARKSTRSNSTLDAKTA